MQGNPNGRKTGFTDKGSLPMAARTTLSNFRLQLCSRTRAQSCGRKLLNLFTISSEVRRQSETRSEQLFKAPTSSPLEAFDGRSPHELIAGGRIRCNEKFCSLKNIARLHPLSFSLTNESGGPKHRVSNPWGQRHKLSIVNEKT